MSQPDDEIERKFLRSFARTIGADELSCEALATSLGLDELTPEKLDAWFETLRGTAPAAGESGDGPRVVQVDPATERQGAPSNRPALPVSRAAGSTRKEAGDAHTASTRRSDRRRRS